ncbi:hypothetical protein HY967_04965 [Candidatus Jorgensenbacteria bacterium]|nr:hypothetical protein [Candidatus Jorgensenbacteria bacterium]
MVCRKRKFSTKRKRNYLAQWFFAAVAWALQKEIRKIFWTHDLRDPEYPKIKLDGLLAGNIIYLDDALTKREATETLIHELCHGFVSFPGNGKKDEKFISQLTTILWNTFSNKEKRLIRKFLPSKKQRAKPPWYRS